MLVILRPNFDLLTEHFPLQELSEIFNIKTDTGFLKTYKFEYILIKADGKAKNLSQTKSN